MLKNPLKSSTKAFLTIPIELGQYFSLAFRPFIQTLFLDDVSKKEWLQFYCCVMLSILSATNANVTVRLFVFMLTFCFKESHPPVKEEKPPVEKPVQPAQARGAQVGEGKDCVAS